MQERHWHLLRGNILDKYMVKLMPKWVIVIIIRYTPSELLYSIKKKQLLPDIENGYTVTSFFIGKIIYLSLNGIYFATFLYAGRIIFPAFMISSIRCALQPAILEAAKSGVYNSSGSPNME